MKKLGPCLVFYLKYPTEMKKLEQDDELDGLDEPEKTRKMADQVAVKSREEAADFLEFCGKGIVNHFSDIGNCKDASIEKRSQIEKNWIVSFGIWPRGSRVRLENWKMKAGISLVQVESEKYEVIPWLWRVGGKKSDFHHHLHGKLSMWIWGGVKIK